MSEWVVHTGDCLEVLPSLGPVGDCFVTDPPYGIDGGRGGQARDRNKVYGQAEWTDTPEYVEAVCVPIIRGLVERGIRGAVTPGLRCCWKYPPPISIGCFWQPCAVSYEPWGLCTSQPILYYGRDARAGIGQTPTGRMVTESPPKISHPCPKPERAWQWLVDKVAGPRAGITVIDPFCGAGGTGVACAALGLNFIGIEIDPGYADIARRRIGEAASTLWTPPKEPEPHPELFAEAVK